MLQYHHEPAFEAGMAVARTTLAQVTINVISHLGWKLSFEKIDQ